MKVWTEAYRPFIMGGDVNAPIMTDIDIEGDPIDVGHGVQVYEIKSPKGQTHIVEATTGAFVGTSLKQVQGDILLADPKIIKQQLQDAMKRRAKADNMSNEDFWRMFR